MIAPVAAMMLQCFFNAASGSATDGIPTMRVPLPTEYAESLASLNPPLSKTAFIGENGPLMEWIIGNSRDPSAPQMKLLRINLTEKILASPYEARFGTAAKQADGNYVFSEEMAGYCNLKPAETGIGIPK
ncbi:MAG: hypothetical protein WA793_00970 [Sphingorhabdus sp.]|uniref:hypothetical protein n=1 Tax=Sphingorhabdus sp. TaxID=1902408 RepID=UPI003CACD8A9